MSFTLSLARGRPGIGASPSASLAGVDLVVGSAPDCDWRLEGTAPRHCQFGFRGGNWLVVDLGGGTQLNGTVLTGPAPITAGDTLAIGACTVTVGPAADSPADALLAAAGLNRAQVGDDDLALLAKAGALLRDLVAGLVRQLAARARAKADLGAELTQFAFGAANPLKVLPPDRALAALMAPPTSRDMPADRAVADAFADLEAHQGATLAAMQQSLAATLERFSPAAIRARAQGGGLLARVMPGAQKAALWEAYEREFDGVAKGSSDAFVELFAREFGRAYREASSAGRPPS